MTRRYAPSSSELTHIRQLPRPTPKEISIQRKDHIGLGNRSDQVTITWGDSRLANQMFRDHEVVAVLDWEMVALGDPRIDLGWWLFLQRFCYRQVMYYVMVKSVATAFRGAVVGWGKLERKATLEAQP